VDNKDKIAEIVLKIAPSYLKIQLLVLVRLKCNVNKRS